MPIDDAEFEGYLRQFRPVPPEELVLEDSPRTARRSRFWWAWACAAAAVLITALLVVHLRTAGRGEGRIASHGRECCASPLTVGGANARLFESGSTREALDRMAFPSQPQLPKGQHSALGVLSQEKIKL